MYEDDEDYNDNDNDGDVVFSEVTSRELGIYVKHIIMENENI
jgi:hypothetical protein